MHMLWALLADRAVAAARGVPYKCSCSGHGEGAAASLGADVALPLTWHARAQVDIWSALAEVAEQAWTLWELLLLAQPLLVLAPSPGACHIDTGF